MVCAPVRSIIPKFDNSLKLGDYLSVQAHKPCSISHIRAFLPDPILPLLCIGRYLSELLSQLIVIITFRNYDITCNIKISYQI